MTAEGTEKKAVTATPVNLPRVTRSAVPAGKDYHHYLPYLREDFWFMCAYCQIFEAEALAIRFTIDHYEPQKARPDLAHEYSNLYYCCDKCNQYKGFRTPTDAQRALGLRFFKIDEDVYGDHFEVDDTILKDKSKTGYFTIHACHLNREALRRLRDLRRRALDCKEYIEEGLAALRHMKIDQLTPVIRGRAATAISRATSASDGAMKSIDDLLRENMKSDLLDEDPDAQSKLAERAMHLGSMGLFPETWHGSRAEKRK